MDEKNTSLRDYFSIIKRRRWHMGLTFLIIMVLSSILAFGLPATYRSTAVIAIEEQEIPDELVSSTISSFADERIQRITQKALTSINLNKLIDDNDLYAEERERKPRSEIVAEMRDDLKMELVSADVVDPRSGRPSKATIAFTLSFDYDSPTVAQKVTNAVVTLVQGTNLDDRIAQTEGTEDFLKSLVDTYNLEVLELENQLAQFKGENEGALPETVAINLELLQRFERDKIATQAQLQALRNRIIFLEAQLLQIDPYMAGSGANALANPAQAVESLGNELTMLRSQYGANHPDVRRIQRMIAEYQGEVGLSGQQSVAQIEEQLAGARAELDSARGSYGAAHPEIARLQRLVGILEDDLQRARRGGSMVTTAPGVENEVNVRAGPGTDSPVVGVLRRGEQATLVDGSNSDWFKIALDNGTSGFVAKSVAQASSAGGVDSRQQMAEGPAATNPAYIQTQANLISARSEAESLLDRFASLQAKIDEYELRIGKAPLVEREYSALTRNLQDARIRLANSKAKWDQARTAVSIERAQKAQQFTLLEPPIAPVTPHSPNRIALLTLGFVLALFGTLAAAAIAESLDGAIRSAQEIYAIAGVAPLASIPHIANAGDSHRSRRSLMLIVGGAVLALVLLLVLFHLFVTPLDVIWYRLLRKAGV